MSAQCLCSPPATLSPRAANTETDDDLFADDLERSFSEAVATRAAQIVVAEDDPAMRELVVEALREDGYEVAEARTGRELLERLRAFWSRGCEPDLVISDVRMPGCSGLQVLSEMNDDDRFAPVVLITAFGDHELHERAATLGAVTVVNKPFDMDELRDLVRRILRSV